MRSIEPKMVEFLNQRLAENGLAQLAIQTRDARTLMLEAAKVCVGIREKTNRNDGPMVELLQKTIGGASGEAWCMSFVQTCVAYAEVKTGRLSHLFPTEHCMTLWKKTDPLYRVKRHPLPGAIAIWNHYSMGKPTSAGHTGFVLGADERTFRSVEGNTSSGQTPEGQVIREGGGVYYCERSMQGFPKISSHASMRLVGFLVPFK